MCLQNYVFKCHCGTDESALQQGILTSIRLSHGGPVVAQGPCLLDTRFYAYTQRRVQILRLRCCAGNVEDLVANEERIMRRRVCGYWHGIGADNKLFSRW